MKLKGNFFSQVTTIIAKNWPQFLRGTAMTLLISIIGTVVGTFIGLMIGVYRTAPKAANKFVALLQKIFGWFLNVYIEVFRGTPMIVQSMVIYYGTAQAFGINIDRTLAAIFIVSINTGAYMSEIVRGGIFAVDKGNSKLLLLLVLPTVKPCARLFFHRLSVTSCQPLVMSSSLILKIPLC